MENIRKPVSRNITPWVRRLELNDEDSQDTLDVPSASSMNILVYRFTQIWGSTTRSHQLSSIFGVSRKSFVERTGFTCGQWLLVLFEMLLSFSSWVFRSRRLAVADLNKRGITERQELIDLYMRRGWGSFISLFVGYFADTYVDIYAMAVLNVALHFVLSAVLFMEITIYYDDDYLLDDTGIVFESVGVLLLLLKATDFARNVFALQILGKKNLKIVLLFVFFSIWFSDRALGGVMVTIVLVARMSWHSKVRLAFVVSLLALSCYLHLFRSPKGNFVTSHGRVGNDFIGCIVTALWTRRRLRDHVNENTRLGNLSWLDYAELKYERVIIMRARDLLKLYCLILSTIGFSLYTVPRCLFYEPIYDRLIPSGAFVRTGIRTGARLVTIVTMGATHLVLIPLMKKLGWKRSFLKTFITGYIFALFCMGYVFVILQSIEEKMPSPGVGMIRILNVRTDNVTVQSIDPDAIAFKQVVRPKQEVLLALDTSEKMLIRVHMAFANTNFTTLISAEPDSMVGYVLLDPAKADRMDRCLPIKELRAGKNHPMKPKLYVYNALGTDVTVEFRNSSLGVFQFKVTGGQMVDDQLPPGRYDLRTLEFESNGTKGITMDAGGFYGVIAHESSLETLLTTDTVVTRKRIDSMFLLGIQIPYALALTLGFVSLRGMVFYNTPEGMDGMSFGFLVFVDNLTNWFVWIGFKVWHPFITGFTYAIYLVLELLLMFSCIAVFVKFKGWYKYK